MSIFGHNAGHVWCVYVPLRKHAHVIYRVLYVVKMKIFSIDNYFSYFCPEHKYWVHVRKVQVGKDQEKAQSEKDSHSKNRGGKKPN